MVGRYSNVFDSIGNKNSLQIELVNCVPLSETMVNTNVANTFFSFLIVAEVVIIFILKISGKRLLLPDNWIHM